MPGLFGILSLGSRSLQTQQSGIEVAGHNIANANNTGYTRQRLLVQATSQAGGQYGSIGTGIEGVAVQQLRDVLLDAQITSETSISGSLDAQQTALQQAQASLGEQLDRLASGTDSTNAIGNTHSLSTGLSDLFNAFQTLANDPTSPSARQSVLLKAQSLGGQFNQIKTRFDELDKQLNQSVGSDVQSANQLMSDIAKLNGQITANEAGDPGSANDLRDLREQKLEALAKIVKVDVANGSNGAVDLSIGGVSMVSGKSVADTLQTVDPGNGRLLVQAAGAGTTLNMTGGSLHGTIDARDGAIANTESQVNALAAAMIKEVNAVHATGFSLGGTSGNDFFTGTGAGNIAVTNALVVNPSLIQASGDATAAGNNKVALALAQLGTKPFASLGNQSFAQNYSATVASLGSSLNTVNNQIGDQGVVTQMLKAQRDSSSGVSLDEEMTDLTRYQKAYQASARLINTIDDLLDVALSLKR